MPPTKKRGRPKRAAVAITPPPDGRVTRPAPTIEPVCTCAYQNDPYKAPEQHALTCPVRMHLESVVHPSIDLFYPQVTPKPWGSEVLISQGSAYTGWVLQ